MRVRNKLLAGAGLAVIAGAALVPVGGEPVEAPSLPRQERPMDLSSYSAESPPERVDLVFLHHSVGGQLLAAPGDETGASSIHETHPNGGGLRRLLEEAGYEVHEASYDSLVGQDTDLRHWVPKFRAHMDRIRRVRMQDELLPEGRRNRVVLFKSCYPNSDFSAEGVAPGDASMPAHTVHDAKAAMRALLPLFRAEPDTLFVYLTAPPIAPRLPPQAAWKWALKRVLGRGMTPERLREGAARARAFNRWLTAEDGWLAGYEGRNVVAFDYFDVLTAGRGDLLAYPTGEGLDSHPSATGQRAAAEAIVPFVNRAARRAGLFE